MMIRKKDKKIPSYTTHVQVFQVTGFVFVNKPTSDLLYLRISSENLPLNIRFLHRVKFHWTAVDTGLMMAC
jgi:hypothetical protein